jgi:C-terminal processing protease CtpA/Prc
MNLLHRPFRKTINWLLYVTTLLVLSSCNLFTDPNYPATENEYVYEQFKEWYLWNDQLPEIKPNDYATKEDLIKALRVDVDRWSYAGSYSELKKLLEAGEFTGFGASFILDADNQVRVTRTYPESTFGRFGVERGWIMKSANGFGPDDLVNLNKVLASTEPVNFEFIDNQGNSKTALLKKEVVKMNTVLYSTVFERGTHKIGYVVFDSFLEISESELNTVFTTFQQNGITDLIVDLRYNGGGMNTIAHQLIGIIGGSKVADQIITKTIHNPQKKIYNVTETSKHKTPVVNLPTVYFLTTSGTASASELVINSLVPFMEVKLVGSRTHGKPVGMYVFHVDKLDLAILPICFKTANRNNYGDYYSGIPVQIEVSDDLTHNWGNPEEAMLKAAINDILEPALASANVDKSVTIGRQKNIEYTGLNQFINAW